MSRENIEIVARDSAALNRGDVDEAMQFFAPDAELRDLAGAPDQPGVVKGADAIREAWLLWTAEFDELSDEPEEWIDAGDVVIRRTHWQGRGKASGITIDRHQFDLCELRDGMVVRAIFGLDSIEEALEATGGLPFGFLDVLEYSVPSGFNHPNPRDRS
jgi:ketosteroid isomerase-like protein